MIKIKNVTKEIKGKIILDDISLELQNGSVVLLKGHNGCGKTMLLRLIAGFIKPNKGEVEMDENTTFGVIIENPSFILQETALENLKFLAKINNKINEETILEYLKKFNLFEYRNNKVKTFSLGMKQRLALCQAFMEDPDVLILDEPFNAIDEDNLKDIVKIINEAKKQGKLIVIASHGDVSFVKFDKVVKMNNGKVS